MTVDPEADIGHGITLFRSTDGGTTFVEFANIEALQPPGFTRDAVEATTTDSPNRTREYIPGLGEYGDCVMTVLWTRTLGALAQTILQAAAIDTYRITFPDGSTGVFTGFLTGYNQDTPMDDMMTAELTFKASGYAFTAAASAPVT